MEGFNAGTNRFEMDSQHTSRKNGYPVPDGSTSGCGTSITE